MTNLKELISGFTDEASENFDEQLKVAKELGMNYICLRGIDGKNISDISVTEFKEELLPKLKRANLKVSSFGSPIGKISWNDQEVFEKQCAQLEILCQQAISADCPYIRMFSFFINPEKITLEATQMIIEKLTTFTEIAKSFNIILLHENEKGIFGDTGERCKTLFSQINSPNFRGIFDFANFVQVKEEPEIAYDLLREWIDYIHIKDALWENGKNVLCGTGDGKISLLLKRFIDSGYHGFLTLEPHLHEFVGLNTLGKDEAQHINQKSGATSQDLFQSQYAALVKILEEDI